MTLADLASLGSFVSSIAVLISLIYVGLQVRQNTKHTRALISQGLIAQLSQTFLSSAEADAAGIAALQLGYRADPGISDEQLTRFQSRMTATFLSAEDVFLQGRDGLINKAIYESAILSFSALMESPGARAAWSAARRTYGAEFRAFMDDLIAKTPMKMPTSAMREAFADQRQALEHTKA